MIYLTGGKIQISVNKIFWVCPYSAFLLKHYLPKTDLKINIQFSYDKMIESKIRWKHPCAYILPCFPSYIVMDVNTLSLYVTFYSFFYFRARSKFINAQFKQESETSSKEYLRQAIFVLRMLLNDFKHYSLRLLILYSGCTNEFEDCTSSSYPER